MRRKKKACVNYYADKSQYAEYKKQLGTENVPETLEDFQKLKYNNKEEWDKLKAAYRATKSERSCYKYSTDGTFIATNHRKRWLCSQTIKAICSVRFRKIGWTYRTYNI